MLASVSQLGSQGEEEAVGRRTDRCRERGLPGDLRGAGWAEEWSSVALPAPRPVLPTEGEAGVQASEQALANNPYSTQEKNENQVLSQSAQLEQAPCSVSLELLWASGLRPSDRASPV